MNYFTLSALINFILSIFLGIVVFTKNRQSGINLTFSLFAFTVAFWSIAYFFWQNTTVETDALFWSKILMAFAIFIPAFYLHFILNWIGSYKYKIVILSSTYALFTGFLFLDLFSSQFISGVKPALFFKFWPIPGIAFHLFLLVWASLVVYSTFLLYSYHQKSVGLIKTQTKYLLLGMIIGFTGGSTNYLLWYGIPIPPIGNILVSVYVALTAFAIIRHSFLDIRSVVARAVSFTLLVTLVGLLYTVVFALLSSRFLTTTFELRLIGIFTVLTLIVVFSFQTIRKGLEKITDKIFYKDKYDTSRLLYDLALVMASTLELKNLIRQLINTLITQMRISRGMFILTEKGNIYDVEYQGYTTKPILDKQKISKLLNLQSITFFEELEEGEIKKIMREEGVVVAIPLYTKGEDIDLLVLGEKLSGDIYTTEDINLLKIFLPEVTVAIQNAKSYDQIKRFNVTLKEEVSLATGELKITNQKLKDLDKLKDDFVSVASHELRTPMTAIRSYVWMALHKSDIPLSQKLEKYLYRTLISTERLINLVNDMLNVSRIESGRIEITPKAFDIVALTKEVMEEVKIKASEKSLQLSVMDHKMPPVFADADKIHQILLNLIGNSLKFTYPGGQIIVDFFTDGKVVDVLVKDNGAGISKEDLSKLFHKFGRLDNSYVSISTSGGTGLGLYISKSLIEMMQGKIWASSEGVDKGAIFTFSLPLANEENLKHAADFKVNAQRDSKPLEPVAI